MRVLSNLEPYDVFKYFEDICLIPHASGNMEQINKYCIDFAKKHNLEYYTDSLLNVVIKKPASAGYENHPPIILQGHLDMVCEAAPGVEFDFESSPLNLEIDGDFIKSKGTTLGGDDGIAVAMILAILENKNLSHPKIEAVFTTDEETGLFGAQGLDTKVLDASNLINIDSEKMGVLTVSCAGGARADLSLSFSFSKCDMPYYKIKVGGLIGGHSGAEIDKRGLNANKVMGEFLGTLNSYQIAYINGGTKDNVITKECECVVATDDDISKKADLFVKENKNETDKDLFIDISACSEMPVFSESDSKKAVSLINALPYGVIKMSKDIENLVQTSLNMGIIKTEENCLHISFSVRSSVKDEKQELLDRLNIIAKQIGASFSTHGHYPAWQYKKDSKLRDIMAKTYLDLFDVPVKIEAIHAGLECGMFSEKIKNFDAVSIGPDLYDIHTPDERLSVTSVKNCYKYLTAIMKNL